MLSCDVIMLEDNTPFLLFLKASLTRSKLISKKGSYKNWKERAGRRKGYEERCLCT